MKNRNNDDFPFNDVAGHKHTEGNLPSGQGGYPSKDPGEALYGREHTGYPPKPQMSSAQSSSDMSGQKRSGGDYPQSESYLKKPDLSIPQYQPQYRSEQSGSRQPSGRVQDPAGRPNVAGRSYNPGKPDAYGGYSDQGRVPANAPQRAGGNPYGQAAAPRPRTLNRQIQILSMIALVLFIVMCILLTMIVAGGKKKTAAADTSKAAASGVAVLTLTPAAGISTLPAGSDASVTPNASSAASDTAAPDTDPNSLANLPPSAEHPVIALTFDDGPSPTYTAQLLDTLEAKGVHATFFVLGQMVLDADPALLQRMAADGNEIGNHSYDHSIYTDLTEDQIRAELTKTNDAIFAACGVTPTVMRPPTGGSNDTVLALSKEYNMAVVNWSYESCPEDWLKDHQTAEFISNYVVENAANGHIVLLHDIRQCTVDSIAAMIDGLSAKGYRFATVSELLATLPEGKQTGVLYCYGA